ncbi:MAG: septum formation initiator family protein [Anaerolineaceae bacterium]|nr:septum formation initiator family protein [Anaerolineaceae bacterium]
MAAKTPPETTPQPEKRKRTTGQLSGLQIMFAAILAIGLILAINFSSRITAAQPLQQLYAQVSGEIERLRQEQGDLIAERDYVQSDAYVESWARDAGKMVRPGEILVIPKPAEIGTEPTPVPPPDIPLEIAPPEPDTWQVWWALFFDSPPPKF